MGKSAFARYRQAMVKWYDPSQGDAFTAHLFRFRTGLRPSGNVPRHDVLATYRTQAGAAPFAFCRDGLLIDPEGVPRHIPYVDVEDAGVHNCTMIERAKHARCETTSEPLTIQLVSGETIDLPVEVRDDGMPDLLTIAKLIHRRAIMDKAAERRA
ncbi:hypothetical protein BH10PSE14_BH10PSE14_19610 [soil metagenome]